MLDELTVRNLGLIPSAHLEPGPGLVVISGETGTGKTLLLGALRLLRGEQARKDQIGPSGDETVVEARFLGEAGERVLGRRVDVRRSRATIDGSLATAGNLAEALTGVLDVVGQHDRTVLSDPRALRRMLDDVMGPEGKQELESYAEAWSGFREVVERAAALGGDRRALERELDMVRFQRDEIGAAAFSSGEDRELAERVGRLRNAEELRERLGAASAAIGDDGAVGSIERAGRDMRAAARTDPSLSSLADLTDQAAEVLNELRVGIARAVADLEHEPGELDRIEQRLALLSNLRRKYGDDLESVIEHGAAAERRATEIEGLLGQAGAIDEQLAEAQRAVDAAAEKVHRTRRDTGDRIAAAAVKHLRDLGFSEPVVEFDITRRDPGPDGGDQVVLQFASDRDLEAAPISKVASGGELSRLILALRLAAGAGDVAVVAFDEIDAGTGGETALAMARKLQALAADRQVFCVTHLPQVAAFADSHFVVRRNGNVASVERLEGEQRLEELSRMLAGLPDSKRGRAHAMELLKLAHTA